MHTIQIDDSDIRPFVPDRSLVLAEKVLGWQWWAYKWEVRTESGREEIRVRSLRPPDFPDKRWQEWGKKDGNDLRLADGTEPLHKCQSTGDAYALPRYEDYYRDANAAEHLADALARTGARVSIVVGKRQCTCTVTLKYRSRMIVGRSRSIAGAISEAAYNLPNDWDGKEPTP